MIKDRKDPLGLSEAVRLLGVSRDTIRARAKKGILYGESIGFRRYVWVARTWVDGELKRREAANKEIKRRLEERGTRPPLTPRSPVVG
jgi:hypothetical protein